MKIHIETIPPEGLMIQEQELPQILAIQEKDFRFCCPVDISLTVNLASGNLLVNGAVKTGAEVICSRCLKKIKLDLVNNNINFNVELGGKTEIDITPEIREGIIIVIPIKPLCKPDCRGLCPCCGQDLNEKECACNRSKHDIRWSELDKL